MQREGTVRIEYETTGQEGRRRHTFTVALRVGGSDFFDRKRQKQKGAKQTRPNARSKYEKNRR
jgi:hypothetical protein